MGLEIAESLDVSRGEVEDVDVIADGSPIGGRIIIAVDIQRTLVEGGVDGEGDQMGLWFVGLAKETRGIGATGIEVTEYGEAEPVRMGKVLDHALTGPLGFAVGVEGVFGVALSDGEVKRSPVDSSCGGEDEVERVGLNHGLEKRESAKEIFLVIEGGVGDRVADIDERSEVDDGFRAVVVEGADKGSFIFQVGLDVGAETDGPGVTC